MSTEKNAKKFLTQIGFKDSDVDTKYETDFVPAINQNSGGIIFVEYSTRFSSFKKLVSHIEKQLNIKANVLEKNNEVDFNIKDNDNFDYLVAYKENDMNKIYLKKKKIK